MADIVAILDEFKDDYDDTADLLVFLSRRQLYSRQILTALPFAMKKRREKIRITNYVENIIPQYIGDDFRERFRMDRGTFELLLQQLGLYLSTGDNNFPVKISPQKQLLIYIKYAASQLTLQMLADLFGVGEATVFRIIRKVSSLICEQIMRDVIAWPSRLKQQHSVREFEQHTGFPGVIGAIDGSHIPIRTPKQQPEKYVNRKGYHSIILQAVCDADMHFIDLYCGWPGSVHDARVLNNSPLSTHATNTHEYFTDNTHLLGDAAYSLQTWLLTPYKDYGNLNARQKKYNYVHSSARMEIERAFGSLNSRFRRLKYIEIFDIECIVKVILSCCILHEFCLRNDDVFVPDNADITEEVNNFQSVFRENRSAELKRQHISELLNNG